MTSRLALTLACLLGGSTGAFAQVAQPVPVKDDRLKEYLTPDGKLRASLEVREEKKGFGTFAGMVYHIEPDGKWTITEIFRNVPTPRGQGQLSPKDLKRLAGALLQYDLLNLPNVGRPKVNPHVLTISFGGKQAVLTFGVDQVATQPAPGDPNPGLIGRFGGIAGAVRGLMKAPGPGGVPAG
jgi:hypothetical protein